ncbi:MAG: AMP-binding protein [Nitrolancea sp.]
MDDKFIQARDFLMEHREDYEAAYRGFIWPDLDYFNWALDYFDRYAEGNDRSALTIVGETGVERRTFAEMTVRSNKLANFLRELGASRGDRILLISTNSIPLWESMLAAIKLGLVMIPATTALTPDDLEDRFERGHIRHVISDEGATDKLEKIAGNYTRIAVGGEVPGWRSYQEVDSRSPDFTPDGATRADDPLLLYFTSGTTSKPKLVLHTHQSYSVGHLSTMYWIGLKEGDVHLNISSPGWAKHAWSSFFAPWNAGAEILIHDYARFDAKRTLQVIADRGVTTLCAPPTVWRLLILEDLTAYPVKLREVVSAGEPLNPEVIERVRAAWGLTIRDGYGQTETTAQIGNTPGQPIKPGSVGRPLPGYDVALLDPEGMESDDGEIALRLTPRPLGLMQSYLGDTARSSAALEGDHYRTSDVASRDADGYFWYVGRTDDVFKSSDYRISPFELESVLIEHPAVAEAAIVPSPHPTRGAVPKAYVIIKPGFEASAELAAEILGFCREQLAPFKRIRRLEFAELPKTVSGKIRRVQLRAQEVQRNAGQTRGDLEFWEEDLQMR